jgi:hypothetical protein
MTELSELPELSNIGLFLVLHHVIFVKLHQML